jgi:hypothetical protein
MKTNHQRRFVAYKDPRACEIETRGYGNFLPLSDRTVGAIASAGDSTNGKHGIAQKRRGAKKFVRSRTRFHENSAVRKLITEED